MNIKFMNVVYGLIGFIVGAVILLTILPAILPTFYSGLNTTNGFSYCATGYNVTNATCYGTSHTLPLANMFALNGILPLVLVAAVFVAVVFGAIAMVKGGKSKR